ncbi:MAG: PHP domain-containing protein [Deltaproteobacteria bacterium]|jgi:predicted metal-dependent phosphoesterase TrpH|nr:PHP domain-containing protein [Deltaproteobacteria bacterium]
MEGIDLHIHSTASDGTLSPAEILKLAQKLKLKAIAITDHDTIDGSKEALQIGIPPSINFLTGVEISASSPPSISYAGSFHILGYSIKLDDPQLNTTLAVLQQARKNRNPKIVKHLNDMGFEFSLEDVASEIGNGQLGRPHIARYMLKRGFVKSIDEAFRKYIAQGKPAYVDKYRVDCERAIEIILEAGGIPVLAHPILLNFDKKKTIDLFALLKDMGLKGVEVYYPENSPDMTTFYIELAQRYGLLKTGGTDFHGSLKPDIQMGSGRGDFFVPYEVYKKIVRN